MVAEGVAEAVVTLLGTVADRAVVAVDLEAAGATAPEVVGAVRAGTDPVIIGAVAPTVLLLLVGALRGRRVEAMTKMMTTTAMIHRETVVGIDALILDPLTLGVPPSFREKVMVPSSLGKRLTP